jgi:hypothetical protein
MCSIKITERGQDMTNHLPQDESVNKPVNAALNSLNEGKNVKNTGIDKKLKNKRRIKKAIWFIVIIFLVYKLFNCGANHYDVTWEEEVQLDDKNIIWVKRNTKGVNYMGLGGFGSSRPEGNTLSLVFPLNGIVFPPLHNLHDEILLDFEASTKKLTVVTAPDDCPAHLKGKENISPYMVYQSVNGSPWNIIPMPSRLIGRTKNLLLAIYKGEKQSQYIFLPYMIIQDMDTSADSYMPGDSLFQIVPFVPDCFW